MRRRGGDLDEREIVRLGAARRRPARRDEEAVRGVLAVGQPPAGEAGHEHPVGRPLGGAAPPGRAGDAVRGGEHHVRVRACPSQHGAAEAAEIGHGGRRAASAVARRREPAAQPTAGQYRTALPAGGPRPAARPAPGAAARRRADRLPSSCDDRDHRCVALIGTGMLSAESRSLVTRSVSGRRRTAGAGAEWAR